MSRLDQVVLNELLSLGADVNEGADGLVSIRIPENRYADETAFIVASLPYNGWDPRPAVRREGGFVIIQGYVD